MGTIRKILQMKKGFTLVELMVVVVVLGILAGIAVQRMGDVRQRAEEAADDANARLLLGSANLAKTRHLADPEHHFDHWPNPYCLRWQRPCAGGPPVVQRIDQHNATYGETRYNDPDDPIPSDGGYFNGHASFPGTTWEVNEYFESFPAGYAVEINFFDDEYSFTTAFGNRYDSDPLVYQEEGIRVYRFIGTEADFDWTTLEPNGSNYPYASHPTDPDAAHELDHTHWKLIFPENE